MSEVPIPLLAAAIAVGLIGLMAVVINFRLIRWAVAAMMFAACVGSPVLDGGDTGTWLVPVGNIRAEIFLAGGLLVLFAVGMRSGDLDLHKTSAQIWILIVVTLYQALLRVYHGIPFDGLRTVAAALFTILPVMLGLTMFLKTWRDFYILPRIVMYVSMALIFCAGVQVLIDPSQLAGGWSTRYIGFTGNGVQAALIQSVITFFALWLSLNEPNKKLRILWWVLLGVNGVLLIATGSRTGVALILLGSMALLYRRLGKAVLLLPVVGLMAVVGLKVISLAGVDFGYERVLSTEDTRTHAWISLFQEGMQSPIFGNGVIEVERNESSYLWAFAAFGAGCMGLILALLAYSIHHCWKLFRISGDLEPWKPVIDLIIGFNVIYFAGAVLEGYIILRANIMLVGFLIVASMSAVLWHAYRHGTLDEMLEDEDEGYEGEFEDEYYDEDEFEPSGVLAY